MGFEYAVNQEYTIYSIPVKKTNIKCINGATVITKTRCRTGVDNVGCDLTSMKNGILFPKGRVDTARPRFRRQMPEDRIGRLFGGLKQYRNLVDIYGMKSACVNYETVGPVKGAERSLDGA